jgi:hypothetical protein
MPDNGLKFTRTQSVILASTGVILGVAFIVILLLIAAGKFPGCEPAPMPDFSKNELAPPNTSAAHELGKGGSSLPDIQILQTNPYGIDPLATKFRFVSDTQFTVNCPLALFGGGSISSSDPRMDHFLEVKSAQLDANGNIIAFKEFYKPGSSNEAGYYVFDPDCIPTLSCPPLAHDTLKVNQWDEYLVNYGAFGVGRSIHSVKPNAGPVPFPECGGCAGKIYSFGVSIDTVTVNGVLTWTATRDDSFLTKQLIAALKKL